MNFEICANVTTTARLLSKRRLTTRRVSVVLLT
jgi:hypothetical protein